MLINSASYEAGKRRAPKVAGSAAIISWRDRLGESCSDMPRLAVDGGPTARSGNCCGIGLSKTELLSKRRRIGRRRGCRQQHAEADSARQDPQHEEHDKRQQQPGSAPRMKQPSQPRSAEIHLQHVLIPSARSEFVSFVLHLDREHVAIVEQRGLQRRGNRPRW